MKKSISIALSATAIAALTFTSCKKITQQPIGKRTNSSDPEKNVTHIAGIASIQDFPVDDQVNLARYQIWAPSVGQQPLLHNNFGGTTTSTVKGFATSHGVDVYAYKKADGHTYLNISGSENPLLNGTNTDYATFTVDEIEMSPADAQYVYLLVKEGNGMRLYRYDINSGLTDPIVYEYSPGLTKLDIFQNVSGNGYRSGSITFVRGTPTDANAFRLVFTHESTVYSSLGISTSHLLITGTTVKPAGTNPITGQPYNKTYSTATSGLGGLGTGNLNTAFGDGTFYISREGQSLFSLNINTSNTAATQIATSSQFNNKYDFGYYDNYFND